MASGLMPALSVEAADGDELLAAAMGQLDDGADLVKLYLDGPDLEASPWSVDELRRVVGAVHARGARVTAHSGYLAGARAGAEAGVDALEHGFELDADVAAAMVRNGVRLVSTLAVMASWETFATTTTLPRFASPEGRSRTAARRERAVASVGIAHRAGVSIATGTDFGGGSTRANQLAWEVEQLVGAGLSPWEALGCATWRGGELLGEPDAGTIREGGPADFAWSTATRCPTPPPCGGCGTSRGRADRLAATARRAADIVIRPSRKRSFVAARSRRASVGPGDPVRHYLVIGRHHRRPLDKTRKETPVMSAQSQYLEVDAVGVFPALLLFLVMFLTALGIVAHVAFG